MRKLHRLLIYALIIILVFPVIISNTAWAASIQEENKNKCSQSRIHIPWTEFKNLLKLDKDEIELTWEELNRLLQQTDPKLKPEYDLIEGRVFLSHDELKRIIDHFIVLPPPRGDPVRDYVFTKALYTGNMGKEHFVFTADFSLTVLKEKAYIKIPVLSSSLALKSMAVNEAPAVVVHEGGYHCLIIDKAGEYRVRAVFSVKSFLNKGPHRLRFPIKEAPITLIQLEIPVPDIEVTMPCAHYLETTVDKEKTLVKAVLAACGQFDLEWKKKMVSAEKVPAMIYAESYQLISVEDDALKINQDIAYQILQSGVNSLKLAVSEGMTVLSVSGPAVGDWREIEEGDRRLLYIPFDYEQKGTFTISIQAEKSFQDMADMIEFAGLKVLDTVSGLGEKGYIGVELKTGAELLLKESFGLEKIMVKKLSDRIFRKSTNPILLGFKYLKHPYNLVLEIKKHEKVALPQAAIDSASVVSFFTEDGFIIHKVEYAVKNQLKQSLRLAMPEGASLWSAMVGGESVEVRQDKDYLYIPLISSRQHNRQLESFKVELIYYTDTPKFTLLGQRGISLPRPDLMVSQILWSVYLPENYIYYRFMSNLEKEQLAGGLIPIFHRRKLKVSLPGKSSYEQGRIQTGAGLEKEVQKYAEKRGRTVFRNIDITGKMMSQQAMNEFDFDNRLQQIEDKMIQGEATVQTTTGVLPMNIQIPTSGQLFRFAKNIVRDEELKITMHYFKETVFKGIAWFCILVIILIIFLGRQKVKSVLLSIGSKMSKIFQASKPPVKRFFQSKLSLPILGLIFLFSLSVSFFYAIVSFLILWITAMVHVDKRIKRSKPNSKDTSFMIIFFLFSYLLVGACPPLAYSQQAPTQQYSQVSLDWNEFKKTIDLDKDEIQLPWDEFQKIVNQTPKKINPVYTLRKGKVCLSRKQFDRLLGQMIVPEEKITAPFDYRLTKAVYSGKITENGTTITVEFILEVLNEKGYKLIPFLSSRLALHEVLVNDQPALLLSEGGYHQVIIKGAGTYRLKAVFSMKSSLNQAHYQVSIPVLKTAVTLLELEIPMEDITVKVPRAQQVTILDQDKSTRLSAVFPPVNDLTIQWYSKKVAPVQKIPAKIYATGYSLVSIHDDALRVSMDIECNILHAGVDTVQLLIPDGLNILAVKGQGVGEWREKKQDNQKILSINLDYEHKGLIWLTIEYEKTMLDAAGKVSFSSPRVFGAVKETGYVGLELKSSAEVRIIQHEGLEKVAVQKLPPRLFQKSVKPLMYGFKYLKHPFALEMEIRRHPKVSPTMAVIDSANAVSFFTEDGKVVHRIIYEVRNQLKQFLKIRLPQGAELWSVFVGDKPSEPSREKDVLYIPLIRSPEEGHRLKPFRVEAVYYQEDSVFSSYGQKSVFLPEVTEIMVSKILWSLYLPKDYHFLHFKGNLEKERLAGGLRPIMGCSKRTHYLASKKKVRVRRTRERLDQESITGADKTTSSLKEEKSDTFGKFQADRKDLLRQQAMEKGFAPEPKEKVVPRKPHTHITSTEDEITAGYDTAVVSIPIAIPVSGQLYRFAKAMVRQEPLKITLFYTRAWIMSIIGWFVLFVVLGIVIALRKKVYEVSGYGQRVFHTLENNYNALMNMASKVCRAGLTPLILIGFLLVCVVTAHFFLVFLLFLVELGLIVHQRSYWFAEKRAQLPQEIFPEEQKEEMKSEAEAEIQTQKDAGPKSKRRKWLWIIILNLGLILFIGGYIISSIGRYPNYRLIFLSAVAAILYYMGLFVWWLIHKMKGHKMKGRK